MYKLGIDVGGTNTDAVLIDKNLNIIASTKQHTTANIYDGILNTVRTLDVYKRQHLNGDDFVIPDPQGKCG